MLIKLYSFLSPLVFIFLIIKFYEIKENKFYKINYIIIFLIFLFPIYKYSEFNSGIGKKDSFPSIIHSEMKKNFDWKININKFKQCSNIIVDINDYFKKSYILLRLYNDSNLYKITDNKGINFDDTCYLVENNKQFLLFSNSNENRNNNLQ